MSMHKKLLVGRKVNISASFDPEDWELFCSMDGVEEVAHKLNERLEFLVNTGFSKNEVRENMYKTMGENRQFGACDSEPIRFLDRVLDQIFLKECA